MTRDELIRMTRESGLNNWELPVKALERFAELAIADFLEKSGQYVTNDASREAAIAGAVAMEREECAKLCERMMSRQFAAIIRDRGNKEPS